MLPNLEAVQILGESSIGTVERDQLADCARRFALLGQVHIARQLVDVLQENGSTIGFWIIDDFLEFAWEASGQRPKVWPLNRPESSSEKGSKGDYETNRNKLWHGLSILEDTDNDDRPTLDALLAARDDGNSDATSGSSAIDKSERLVRALEISITLHNLDLNQKTTTGDRVPKKTKGIDGGSLRSEVPDSRFKMRNLDPESAAILNKIVARLHANQQISRLGAAKRLWPFYVRGLLADAVDLSKEVIGEKGQELLQAFVERFQRGHVPSRLASKSIRELLEMGDRNTREHVPNDEAYDMPVPESLFSRPATDDEIKELQERLETVLPDDYKEFLRITNGFGLGDDETLEVGIFDGISCDPQLHDTSKVEWQDDKSFQLPATLLNLSRQYEDLIDEELKRQPDEQWDLPFPLFDRVLEVGHEDVEYLWLIHPDIVEQAVNLYKNMLANADEKQERVIIRAMESFAGSREAFEGMQWCFADYLDGEIRFHANFTKYLEHVVLGSMEDLNPQPEEDEVGAVDAQPEATTPPSQKL